MSRLIVGAAIAAALFFATAAAATPPIEEYGKLPAVEQLSLSPSGDMIAYLAGPGDKRKLIVSKTTGGPPVLVVDASGSKVRSIDWYGDDHVAIAVSQTATVADYSFSKDEIYQVAVFNVNSRHSIQVFHDTGNKVFDAVFGWAGYVKDATGEYGLFKGITLSTSGNPSLDISSGTRSFTNGYADLYRVNLETGLIRKVAAGSDGYSTTWVMAADGTIAAQSRYKEENGEWRLYGPDGNSAFQTATSAKAEVRLLGLGRTPDTVVVLRPGADHDWQRVEYKIGDHGAGQPLFEGKAVQYGFWDSQTRLLTGAVVDRDDPKVIMFDPALQAKADKARHPFTGERVQFESVTRDFNRMILFTEGPGDSGTHYFVDLVAHRANAIGWAYPTILQADVGATQIVPYKAADGLEMEGVLTLPPGRDAKGLPVVVMPHGGPESHDTLGFDYWAQAFASQGYAVFQPNFRGSSGYGKAFRDAGLGQWGRNMQTDISDGLAELVKRGIVDPKRACIVGGSYGGYAALAGVTLQHGIYRCAASYGGVANLNTFLINIDAYQDSEDAGTRYTKEFLGAKSNGDPALRALSPVAQAAQADAPILVMYGRDDTVVPTTQSTEMIGALRAAGKPVEVVVLDGEDHWLSKPASRTEMLKAMVAFVEKYNPPK